MTMNKWRKYNRKAIPAEMRPYVAEEDLTEISLGKDDIESGSPREGDMIARDPSNHADKWLVNAAYFAEKFDTTPL